MSADTPTRLTISARHRARHWAYWNGAVWAIGNGLASSTLVIYLALELDARCAGLGISLIVAAPRIAGLLRLAAPALIGRLADRRRFCLGAYLLGSLVLFGLPLAAAPGRLPSAGASMAALIALWCLYHLLQYLGTIALWSWLADLAPLEVRGRFIGRRERWMVGGQAVAMLAGGLFTWGWHQNHPESARWIGYAIPAMVGVGFMIGSLLPLALMPTAATGQSVRGRATLREMLAPFDDPRFLRLLAFGCWFSFFNGVTQAAQYIYPARVLAFSLFAILAFRTMMRVGQLAVSPWVGRVADRLGNRPVMMVSLALVASGPLFLFLSTPRQPWWFVGAWIVWIAYAGLNVCLPNLMLKLSPGDSNTPYIAAYFAVTGLFYALSTIVGGILLDLFHNATFNPLGNWHLDFYQFSFLFGWITRSLGVLVLLVVIEGPARRTARS